VESRLSIGYTKPLYSSYSDGSSFIGKMNEIMIWKSALTNEEIAQLRSQLPTVKPSQL